MSVRLSFYPLVLSLAWGAPAAAAPVGPEPPLALTLDQAVSLALEKNVDLALAQVNLDTLRSRYRAAWGVAIPNVYAVGTYTRNFEKQSAFFGGGKVQVGGLNSTQGGLEVEHGLFTGGKVMAALRGSREDMRAGGEDLRSAKDGVAYAVRQLFYSVLLASATTSIQEDNLASAERHLATIQERFRQGLDSDLVVLRQQVEVANAKPALIQARNLHELGLTLFKDTLGLDLDRPVTLVGELGPPKPGLAPSEDYTLRALESNPELQSARIRAKAAVNYVRYARGDFWPQLSLFANGRWYAESQTLSPEPNEQAHSSAGGLRLRWPVFTGGEIVENVRQAKLQYEAYQKRAEKLERAARVDVKRQWLAVREALEQAQSEESAIDQARRALEATEVRYKAGEASQLELTDASLALNRVRLLYVQALNDYWVGMAALEKAVGAPL